MGELTIPAPRERRGARRRVPPGPRTPLGIPPRRIRHDPTGFFEEVAAYGDLATFRIGPQRLYMASHPALVQEVLVTKARAFKKGRALEEARRVLGDGLLTSEGELHLRQRRLIQPLFHQERIAGFGRTMVEEAERAVARFAEGAQIDAAEEMTRLTLAIVGRTLFDADVEEDARDIGEALTVALEMFDRFMIPGAGVLERLPLPSTRRFHRARAKLDRVIARMIAERRERPGTHGDLLTMLLEARDEHGAGGMDERQVRDEAMTIFLAGHETTAQALAWTWYLLSEHPEVEARFHAELSEALGGRAPAAGDIPRLPYTRAIVTESMRLYPPAWSVARRALTDVELGGYPIRAGSLVITSQWIVHRDGRWFPDPTRFLPERWLGEQPDRPRFAYFPFGGGNRLCIGERFAWLEAMLVLATIGQRVSLRLVPGWPVELAPRITLRPRHGLAMTVRARDAAVRALS